MVPKDNLVINTGKTGAKSFHTEKTDFL